jgi:hypothetical protein
VVRIFGRNRIENWRKLHAKELHYFHSSYSNPYSIMLKEEMGRTCSKNGKTKKVWNKHWWKQNSQWGTTDEGTVLNWLSSRWQWRVLQVKWTSEWVTRWCIQKYPDWPPAAITANGTALCQYVSQSSEFFRHNPLCCFSTSVYCCCLFLYDSVRKLLDTLSYTKHLVS